MTPYSGTCCDENRVQWCSVVWCGCPIYMLRVCDCFLFVTTPWQCCHLDWPNNDTWPSTCPSIIWRVQLNIYAAGVCSNPSKPCCSDGIMNGDEEGKDCGGSCATKCPQAPEDKCANIPEDTCGFEVYGPLENLCSPPPTVTSSKEECCQRCVNNDNTSGECNEGKCRGFVFLNNMCFLQYSPAEANACGAIVSDERFFCAQKCIWVKLVMMSFSSLVPVRPKSLN